MRNDPVHLVPQILPRNLSRDKSQQMSNAFEAIQPFANKPPAICRYQQCFTKPPGTRGGPMADLVCVAAFIPPCAAHLLVRDELSAFHWGYVKMILNRWGLKRLL